MARTCVPHSHAYVHVQVTIPDLSSPSQHGVVIVRCGGCWRLLEVCLHPQAGNGSGGGAGTDPDGCGGPSAGATYPPQGHGQLQHTQHCNGGWSEGVGMYAEGGPPAHAMVVDTQAGSGSGSRGGGDAHSSDGMGASLGSRAGASAAPTAPHLHTSGAGSGGAPAQMVMGQSTTTTQFHWPHPNPAPHHTQHLGGRWQGSEAGHNAPHHAYRPHTNRAPPAPLDATRQVNAPPG